MQFAIAGDGTRGGTKIAITGHGFFKDFTVKDGNIIENHGGHDAMSSEVKVQQIVWMAQSGKTLPRAYAFTIKNGDHEQSGKNMEMWREIEGVWLPTRVHMVRNEGSAPPSRARSASRTSRSNKRATRDRCKSDFPMAQRLSRLPPRLGRVRLRGQLEPASSGGRAAGRRRSSCWRAI